MKLSEGQDQGRCPFCGEKMTAGQVFCFACGARPGEYAPHAGSRVRWAVLLGLAVAWLLTLTAVGVPMLAHKSWGELISQTATGRSSTASTRPNSTDQSAGAAANRRLQYQYEHKASAMLREVARLRRAGSSAAVLDWAEVQLEETRRMAAAFSVISDAEAVSDVERFLDERLNRAQARLNQLDR